MTGMTPDNPLIPSLRSSSVFCFVYVAKSPQPSCFLLFAEEVEYLHNFTVKYFDVNNIDIEADKDTKIKVILQFKSDPS